MSELIRKPATRTDEETLEIIRNLLVGRIVTKAYLFGSRARGDATPESDWDILVDLKEKVSLFDLVNLQLELEDAVGQKVDVISSGGVRPRIWPYINADKVLIYEE